MTSTHASYRWTLDDDRRLLDLYRKYTHRGHTPANAWFEIAAEMDRTVTAVKTRIVNLRSVLNARLPEEIIDLQDRLLGTSTWDRDHATRQWS